VQDGRLVLRTAFSRDQPAKIYVQDLLCEDADKVWTLIKGGAHLYVCGDARHMAHDVHCALVDIVSTFAHLSRVDTENYLADMEVKGRFQKDCWIT